MPRSPLVPPSLSAPHLMLHGQVRRERKGLGPTESEGGCSPAGHQWRVCSHLHGQFTEARCQDGGAPRRQLRDDVHHFGGHIHRQKAPVQQRLEDLLQGLQVREGVLQFGAAVPQALGQRGGGRHGGQKREGEMVLLGVTGLEVAVRPGGMRQWARAEEGLGKKPGTGNGAEAGGGGAGPCTKEHEQMDVCVARVQRRRGTRGLPVPNQDRVGPLSLKKAAVGQRSVTQESSSLNRRLTADCHPGNASNESTALETGKSPKN